MEDGEKRTFKFLMTLILIVGFAVFITGVTTLERYEVKKTQRCVKVVDTKYYQTTLFWRRGVPEKYLVLADSREVLQEDAWEYMEFDIEYCDYVYERTKPNVSSQELKTPR